MSNPITIDDRTDARIRVKESAALAGKWMWSLDGHYTTDDWGFTDSEARAWFEARVRLRVIDTWPALFGEEARS